MHAKFITTEITENTENDVGRISSVSSVTSVVKILVLTSATFPETRDRVHYVSRCNSESAPHRDPRRRRALRPLRRLSRHPCGHPAAEPRSDLHGRRRPAALWP